MRWIKSLLSIFPIYFIAVLTIPAISQADLKDDLLRLLDVESDSHLLYLKRLNENLLKEKIVEDKDKISRLKELIQKEVDINAKDKDGMTALMKAARAGQVEMVKILINNGADVNAVEKNGYPVLVVAESMPFPSQVEIIKLLLDKDAMANAKSKDGWTALMEAAKGHSYLIKSLIEKGHKDVAMVPTEFAKLLIEKGVDVNAKYKSGGTALMIAAGNGQTETVRLLIEKGADVKVTDENGNTALMYSVTGFVSLAKRLSKKEELKDFVSIPIEIIKLLINAGAVDVINEDGLTAYSFALTNGLFNIAQSLQPAGSLPANSPILNPQERLQFEGFSILPPQGETWTVMYSDNKGITFGRYTGERLHTIMASVRIKKQEALAVALKEHSDLSQYEKEKVGPDNQRFRGFDIKVVWECYKSKDCARYDFTVEDHGAPYASDSVLILTGYGFSLLHPDGKHIVEISYSQRLPKGDVPISVETEIGPFFRSLVLTPMK